MTILRQQRNGAVGVNRDDRARTGMADDGEIDRYAVGQRGALDAEIDHAKFQYGAAVMGHIERA